MNNLLAFCLSLLLTPAVAQLTPFEKSKGTETATYFEAIEFYRQLDKLSNMVSIKTMGLTDAGYPLQLVLVSADGSADPALWHRQKKAVIFINNGIHAGEPDGIDASMLLVRDIANKKVLLPANVALAIVPVYNIGGSLNRSSYSRANQNGPVEYGFRGNAQNLDLNRDFTKADSKNAQSFATAFHYVQPEILVDNHVSDGADYTYTMTLLTTQYNKLGKTQGQWLKEKLEPALYKSMAAKGWEMTPYVDFSAAVADSGMVQFYDPPRYSSGYAALFQTIGFMPETHMLKPFNHRVTATYELLKTMTEQAALQSAGLIEAKKSAVQEYINTHTVALNWVADSTHFTHIQFKGYEQAFKPSNATGMQRMYYNRQKPFNKTIRFFDHFVAKDSIQKPLAYIVPQGWWQVIDRLQTNGVKLHRIQHDTTIAVEQYRIDQYTSLPRPFEKHHKNQLVAYTPTSVSLKFLKGDYVIPTHQPGGRYIVEMLEPAGDDSFFDWNFFDAILQQKEYYSDYRWDDLAAEVLQNDSTLQLLLQEKKKSDSTFAGSNTQQLNFIYKHSPYYELTHLRYPVYRVVK